jgi:hypothetical protein
LDSLFIHETKRIEHRDSQVPARRTQLIHKLACHPCSKKASAHTCSRSEEITAACANMRTVGPASPSCPGKHVACAPRRLISSSNAMELFRVPRRRVAFETLRTIPVNFAFVSPLRNVRSLAPVRSASDRPHQAWGAGSGKHEPQTRLAHRIAAHGSPGVMSSSSSRGQPQDTVGSAGSLAVLFALRGLGPMLLDPFFFLRSSLGSIDARRVGAGGAWLFVITATTSSVCRCSLRSTAEARGGVAAIRVCG